MTAQPAVPIFATADGQAQDFYLPRFELHSRGKDLPSEVVSDVTQVSYGDDLGQIDHCEITLSNWDDERNTFSHSDTDRFLPGRMIELWLGYQGPGRMRRVITAEITALRPSFPSGGQPTLVVSGLNVLHRLRRAQRTQIYQNLTPTQIARRIGDLMKVQMRTAPLAEQPYDYLIQNTYDVVFLMDLARRSGYELYVEEQPGAGGRPVVFFGASERLHRVTYKLHYGASLIEFQPTLTTTRQVGSVVVRGWDRRTKKPIEVTVKRSELKLGSADDELEPAFNQRAEVITAVIADQAEARRLARDRLRDIAHETVTATGSTVGLPDLRAGSLIEVSGVGRRFSGKYFVTASTHTLGSGGYTTSFTCRRD